MKKRKITWRFLLNGKLAYCAGKQIIAELLDTQHIDADAARVLAKCAYDAGWNDALTQVLRQSLHEG